MAITRAATISSTATMIMAHAPTTAIVETPSAVAIVSYRLYAVIPAATMVVTYMKIMGSPANAGFRPVEASHTVTMSRDRPARSWLDAPNSCHRYTHVPVSTSPRTRIIPMIEATCWFLNPTQALPSHSPRVTRISRNTSWTTVSTMTTNTPNPRAVPKSTG